LTGTAARNILRVAAKQTRAAIRISFGAVAHSVEDSNDRTTPTAGETPD